ncbi:MAG TPA: 3-phosphoshikimate 1-carboxyvinyltransferase [Flavisolibacter sp.]
MQAIVTPSSVSGTRTAPASKSSMQRACAAALIRNGQTILHNPGASADDQAALNIIRQLGAEVHSDDGRVIIDSRGINPKGTELDCGESGLSIRMFTSIAALSSNEITITGGGSLARRPLNFFDEVLPQLNVSCSTREGYLPLRIKGPLSPADITVDGSLSSQYLTGLLLAYAAADAGDVTITVSNLASKPYIDLTLAVMKSFSLRLPENRNYEQFYFSTSNSHPNGDEQPLSYTVEGDWSGAAFLLVAGAVAGNLVVKGLDVFSSQADKAVLQALMQSGASISIEESQVTIGRARLKPFHFNATDCPDLFPPLAVLAAFCEGRSVIEGVHRLKHKESDRAATLQEELGKMGIVIEIQDDLMIITGTETVRSASVHSHGDHRIAMACAVAALRADGPVTIGHAEAVNKSYPSFWQHLQDSGAAVSLNQ